MATPRIPGLTNKQTQALRRVKRWQKELVTDLSVWKANRCEELLTRIEVELTTHFPQEWPKIREEKHPLAG